MLDDVKHVILVLSGKGGVGKSTVSTQLALLLKRQGLKVGLLDIDLCGPSIPYLLQLEDRHVEQSEKGWLPVYTNDDDPVAVMSIGFLLKSRNEAVIWRGPRKTAMVKQFINDVSWGALDYLIVDTPPGTSDEHITVMEELRSVKCDGAIIVTTPQEISIEDVRKEITLCRKGQIPIIGIIENMSGFVCPSCSTSTNIFSKGGGRELAKITNVDFLGEIPIDPRMGTLLRRSCADQLKDSPVAKCYQMIVETILRV